MSKRFVGTAAVALGLVLGAAGVASAVSAQGTSTQPAPTTQTDTSTTDTDNVQDETNDANDVGETPDQEAADDAAEQAMLDSFPVTPDQASATALAAVPGTLDEVEIDDQGTSPVFEIAIVDASGQEIKVRVDPNSGAIIDQVTQAPENGGSEANEGPEANEANEGPEANDAPDALEAPGSN